MIKMESVISGICDSGFYDFFGTYHLEPSELEILIDKLLEDSDECLFLAKSFESRSKHCIGFLIEVFIDLNYLPIIDLLANNSGLKLSYTDKDLFDLFYNMEFLVWLNDFKFHDVILKYFDKISDRDKYEICFNLNQIKNKSAIILLLKLSKILDEDNNYYKCDFSPKGVERLRENLVTLERLENQFEFMFSLEFQIEASSSVDNRMIDDEDDFLNEIYKKEEESFEKSNLNEKKELNDYKDNKDKIIISKVKRLLKGKEIDVRFRSKVNDVGAFNGERSSFTCNLFTNEKITAREIANLFGNKSILYLSGNTKINGKDVFYENAAWYKMNNEMPEEDKVFFGDPSIVKFRVYNVIKNY